MFEVMLILLSLFNFNLSFFNYSGESLLQSIKFEYTNIFLVFGKQKIKICPVQKGGQAILNEAPINLSRAIKSGKHIGVYHNSLPDVFLPARHQQGEAGWEKSLCY